MAEAFAPEHLELLVADPGELAGRVRNAGAVFVGPWTPVALGDYAAGTNHVLPTAGTARFARAVHPRLPAHRAGGHLRPRRPGRRRATVAALSRAEHLPAHGRAVAARLDTGERSDDRLGTRDGRAGAGQGRPGRDGAVRRLAGRAGAAQHQRDPLRGACRGPRRPGRGGQGPGAAPLPDREATELREALALHAGHGFEGTWAANGSNEVLQQLLLAFAGPGRSALVVEPTYAMHSLLARPAAPGW